jgi:hypothetical protein
LIERISAFSEVEVADLSFDAVGVTFAATGDGTTGGDLPEEAVEPILPLLRGEVPRKREDGI